jgi:hypothetical protein
MPEAGELLWLVVRGVDRRPMRLPQFALTVDGDGELLTDGIGWPGMSGGCLVNAAGEVVGVHLGTSIPVPPTDKSAPFYRSMPRYVVLVGR